MVGLATVFHVSEQELSQEMGYTVGESSNFETCQHMVTKVLGQLTQLRLAQNWKIYVSKLTPARPTVNNSYLSQNCLEKLIFMDPLV